MKAMVYRSYGPAEVLHLENLQKPVPKAGEFLIRVMAAEATKADCEMRSFKFAVKWFWLPLRIAVGIWRPRKIVLGGYFSGEIAAAGKQASGFEIGDPVFGSTALLFGAYGEYLCLPDTSTLAQKPANLSFEQAAAVPLGGLNALHFMKLANIRPGDSVLIIGAGGSIGTFAVQIAKTMGAKVTVVDAGIKEAMLRGIGADAFIDYTKQNFAHSDETFDVVFTMVAGSSYRACLGALKPKGRYLLANPRIGDMLRSVFTNRFTDKAVSFAFAGEKPLELETLKTMIESGSIAPVIDRVYPMERAVEAHRRVETEQRLGTIVLSIRGKS